MLALCPNTSEVWIYTNCRDADSANWERKWVLKQVRSPRRTSVGDALQPSHGDGQRLARGTGRVAQQWQQRRACLRGV